AFPLVFLAALSRFINPWLGATGVLVLLGLREGTVLLVLPWLAMAAYLTIQEVRRTGRRLEALPAPGLGELARGAEALSKTRFWRQQESGALSDAFALRASEVRLPGGGPLWFLESGTETLCFLPGALLWIQAGFGARLVPLDQVGLHARPCRWEDPPVELELGAEQGMIELQLPGRPGTWSLLVADGLWSRRAAAAWGQVMAPGGTGGTEPDPGRRPTAPRPVDGDLRAAYRTLGLAPGASPGQIREAYLRLAKACHPDAHPEASPKLRAEYEARMQALNEAYGRLKEAAA
ncbi:MAG TPA: J domain-containing protein, partial [Holophagaceae bacterium]|nr:J domain-containing protein [Holophagaceae bacterium]